MSVQNGKYVTLDEDTGSLPSHQPDLLTSRSVEISTQTDASFSSVESRGGSMIGAIFILMNAVLGAGILEFPYMFSKVGLITALLFLAFLLLCSGTSHIVLAKAVDLAESPNYHELVGKICGRFALSSAQVFLILYCFGSTATYMVTAGDQLQEVCFYSTNTTVDAHRFYCDRHFLIPMCSVVVILPVIWFKNISAFGYVSFFSVASVFYLVAAVYFEYLNMDQRAPINPWYPPDSADPIKILSVLPTMSFAYQCHMTSVPLYGELTGRSVSKYGVVVGVAMFLATSAYLVVGYTGFAIFGGDVDPDIILSFPADSIVMTVGRVAITLSVCMTYPVVLFIGRSALEGFAKQITQRTSFPLRDGNEKFRLASIALWFLFTALFATFASGIKDVISVVGSIAALFMFFYPGCITAVLAWRDRNYAHVFVGSSFMALGAVIFLLNIADTINEHMHGHKDKLLTWWGW
ncbi:hypothetical protein ACHWQZ_G019196 [Mnemiopsis leidyi]